LVPERRTKPARDQRRPPGGRIGRPGARRFPAALGRNVSNLYQESKKRAQISSTRRFRMMSRSAGLSTAR
jgi:hypothetical protein